MYRSLRWTFIRFRIRLVLFLAILISSFNGVSAASTLSWNTSSDWDNAVSEEDVVHDNDFDHSGGTLELGYSYDSEQGLIFHYPLDENSGSTAYDVSGNGNNGVLENSGINQGVNGILSTTAYNIGQYEAIDTTVPGKMDAVRAVSLWFKADRNDITNGGVFWADDGGWDWALITESACGSSFAVADGDTKICTDAPVNVGTWQLLTVEWDPSADTTTLWINGTKEWSGDLTDEESIRNWHIGEDANTNGNGADGAYDNVKFYGKDLSSRDVQDIYDTVRNGSLVTGWRNFSSGRDPGSLVLENVSADLNGQSMDVFVESDVDGDGVVDETSDPVSLNGSGGPYSVKGLQEDSSRFRLDIRLSTSDVTATPTLSSVNLTAESAGPAICDSRGPQNECISDKEHDISSESFTISSIFEMERSAVFNAMNGLAFIEVSNSSSLSGTWKGSFNISTPADNPPVIAPGARFVPSNGEILID